MYIPIHPGALDPFKEEAQGRPDSDLRLFGASRGVFFWFLWWKKSWIRCYKQMCCSRFQRRLAVPVVHFQTHKASYWHPYDSASIWPKRYTFLACFFARKSWGSLDQVLLELSTWWCFSRRRPKSVDYHLLQWDLAAGGFFSSMTDFTNVEAVRAQHPPSTCFGIEWAICMTMMLRFDQGGPWGLICIYECRYI